MGAPLPDQSVSPFQILPPSRPPLKCHWPSLDQSEFLPMSSSSALPSPSFTQTPPHFHETQLRTLSEYHYHTTGHQASDMLPATSEWETGGTPIPRNVALGMSSMSSAESATWPAHQPASSFPGTFPAAIDFFGSSVLPEDLTSSQVQLFGGNWADADTLTDIPSWTLSLAGSANFLESGRGLATSGPGNHDALLFPNLSPIVGFPPEDGNHDSGVQSTGLLESTSYLVRDGPVARSRPRLMDWQLTTYSCSG
ncbi:hypothetical protein VTK56DRAFT_5941 [Thermocarpiscus australiensis]